MVEITVLSWNMQNSKLAMVEAVDGKNLWTGDWRQKKTPFMDNDRKLYYYLMLA
jgi:hypothetical protein